MPFENLSSEPDLTWMGDAVAAIAAAETRGDARYRTFDAATLRDAQTLRATRVITGYLRKDRGAVVIHADVRDEDKKQTVRAWELSTSASGVVDAASEIAAASGAPVKPWPAQNAAAIRDYFLARRAATPPEALSYLERAVAADPSFGAAQIQRAEMLTRSGNRDGALAAVEAARKSKMTEPDAARLELLAAQLRNDSAGQVSALTKLASAEGVNLQLWRSLVEAQMVLKNYRAAAEAANRALELAPRDESMLNLRGYALGFAGDLPAARKAFQEYQDAYPDQGNPLDSLGEVLFYFRQYDEAGKRFLEAESKQPSVVNGGEPFRAALCRFLMNDTAGADGLFQRYLDGRRKLKDPLVPHREAIWLHMTRRTPKPPADPAGNALAALWMLEAGNRDVARALATSARSESRDAVLQNLASAVLLLAQPSASAEEWQARLNRALPDPRQANMRTELLGWALLLDRHFVEAAQVWRQGWERTSVVTANDVRILLTWSLVESGQLAEARKIMPYGWTPPASPEVGFGALLYPKIVDIRARL